MRNYQKKGNKYTDNQLKEAVEDVILKRKSLRRAAKDIGASTDTLRRKIRSDVPIEKQNDRRGKKTVLSPEEEAKLADYLRTLTKWGHGLGRENVLDIVNEYCKQNRLETPFKNNRPGKEWFQNFCLRQSLKLKSTEPLDKNRRQNTSNPYLVYELYDILYELGKELCVLEKADHWYNLDEMGVNHDPTRSKTLAGLEQVGIHRTNQGSGRENTTVMGCVSAAGTCLPPLFIFKAANLWSTWKGNEDLPGTFYSASESGFINAKIFYDYLVHVSRLVKERPLIVVFDGHSSHLDFKTVQFAKNANIALVKLPSHTTDLLQPLDKACFGPFKSYWNKALLNWQRLNQRCLTKSEFVDLVCSVWHDGLSSINIVSGFRGCGLFPVDRTKYPISRFNPLKLQMYLASKEEKDKQETPAVIVIPATGDLSDQQNNLSLSDEVVFLDGEAGVNLEITNAAEVSKCVSNSRNNSPLAVIVDQHLSNEDVCTHVGERSTNISEKQTENLELSISSQELSRKSISTLSNISENASTPGPTVSTDSISNSTSIREGTTFEELLLKRVATTRPPIQRRRLIASNAAVLTSDDMLAKIKQAAENKPSKRKRKTPTPIEEIDVDEPAALEVSGGNKKAASNNKKKAPQTSTAKTLRMIKQEVCEKKKKDTVKTKRKVPQNPKAKKIVNTPAEEVNKKVPGRTKKTPPQTPTAKAQLGKKCLNLQLSVEQGETEATVPLLQDSQSNGRKKRPSRSLTPITPKKNKDIKISVILRFYNNYNFVLF